MAERQLDWDSAIGQQVRIYRNLNTQKMSIQLKLPGIGWRVAGYAIDAVVADVTFTVSERSRQRAIRDRQRNVHAFGQGRLIGQTDESINAAIALGYNPFLHGFFYDKATERSIEFCRYLVVRNNQVFVSGDAVADPIPPCQTKQISALSFSAFWLPAAA